MGSSEDHQQYVSYVRDLGDHIEVAVAKDGASEPKTFRYTPQQWDTLLRQSVYLQEGRSFTKARELSPDEAKARTDEDAWAEAHNSVIGRDTPLEPPSARNRPVIRHMLTAQRLAAQQLKNEVADLERERAETLAGIAEGVTPGEQTKIQAQADELARKRDELLEPFGSPKRYRDLCDKYLSMSDKELKAAQDAMEGEMVKRLGWPEAVSRHMREREAPSPYSDVEVSKDWALVDVEAATGIDRNKLSSISNGRTDRSFTLVEARSLADACRLDYISQLIGELSDDDAAFLRRWHGLTDRQHEAIMSLIEAFDPTPPWKKKPGR